MYLGREEAVAWALLRMGGVGSSHVPEHLELRSPWKGLEFYSKFKGNPLKAFRIQMA